MQPRWPTRYTNNSGTAKREREAKDSVVPAPPNLSPPSQQWKLKRYAFLKPFYQHPQMPTQWEQLSENNVIGKINGATSTRARTIKNI